MDGVRFLQVLFHRNDGQLGQYRHTVFVKDVDQTNPMHSGLSSPKATVFRADALPNDVQQQGLLLPGYVSAFLPVIFVPLSMGACKVIQWVTRTRAQIRDRIKVSFTDICDVYT